MLVFFLLLQSSLSMKTGCCNNDPKNKYDAVEKTTTKQPNRQELRNFCEIATKSWKPSALPRCTIIHPASLIRLLPQFVVASLLLLGGATIFTISFSKTEDEERNQNATRRSNKQTNKFAKASPSPTKSHVPSRASQSPVASYTCSTSP